MKCDKVSHPDCLIFVAVTCELTCGAVWVTYGTSLSGSIAQERRRQNKSMSVCSYGAAGAAAATHQAPRNTLQNDNDINTIKLLSIRNKTQ